MPCGRASQRAGTGSRRSARRRARGRAACGLRRRSACTTHVERVVERGRGQSLAPDGVAQPPGECMSTARRGASAPSLSTTRARSAGVSSSSRDRLERSRKARQRDSSSVRPAAKRVPAELDGSARARACSPGRVRHAGGSPAIERPEPLSSPSPPRANTIAGAVEAVLQPRGDDADDALVPARGGTGTACTRRPRTSTARQVGERLVLHRRLRSSRRSRLSRSSSVARSHALRRRSASRQRMPMDMSARRPAALSRGPATKPRS